MKSLEKFQKSVVQWITGSKVSSYISQLRWLNLLPLFILQHLNNILLLIKMSNELNQFQFQKKENLGRRTEIFKFSTTRTETPRGEFTLRTCRWINNLHDFMDFSVTTGLKGGTPAIMWKFMKSGFSENNVCSWIIFCDCGKCRNTTKKF